MENQSHEPLDRYLSLRLMDRYLNLPSGIGLLAGREVHRVDGHVAESRDGAVHRFRAQEGRFGSAFLFRDPNSIHVLKNINGNSLFIFERDTQKEVHYNNVEIIFKIIYLSVN